MPYGVGPDGGAVMVKPGYDESASSTAGPVNALPTGSAWLSITVHRSRQEAPSSVSASASGEAVWVQVTDSAFERRLELRAEPVGLGVEVEPGDHELHRVAEATELVDAHLQLRRRRRAA